MARAPEGCRNIFLSFAGEDERLAKALMAAIRKRYARKIEVFMFKDRSSIALGQNPFEKVKKALTQDKPLVLVLATPVSVARPWVNFEAGAGLAAEYGAVVLCAKGLDVGDRDVQKRSPLALTWAGNLSHRRTLRELFDLIDRRSGLAGVGTWGYDRIVAEASKASEFRPLSLLDQAEHRGVSQLLLGEDVKKSEHGLAFGQLFARCRTSIRVIGWSCINALSRRDAFTQWQEFVRTSDAPVEFLILDHEAVSVAIGHSEGLWFGPVCGRLEQSILEELKEARKKLRELRNTPGLSAERRRRIRLRATKWVMTWSGVALDVFGPRNRVLHDGLLQVEMFTYMRPASDRPVMVLRDTPGSYYHILADSISAMWKQSKVVELA